MTKLWGVHMQAGVGTRPLDEGYLAIGWPELGDLSKIAANRDAFKIAVRTTFPDVKMGSIPVQAGILFRFVHEVRPGDVVVYPSKIDRTVNIGRFEGPYNFDQAKDTAYPNSRRVKWIKQFAREDFSQAALYEIGSFITLFSIRNHSDEFLAALEGRSIREIPEGAEVPQDDETVARSVSAQAQETTGDFVIRQLKTGIDAYQFEAFIAHLLNCMGYYSRVTAKSRDGGVDVIAHKDQLGFEPPIIKVQCKQITKPIGQPEVAQLVGNVETGEHGLFVALGAFTADARQYERSKAHLRLIDGEQLVELIFENYPKFEPRYQALLPLKRIYVPSLKDADA